MFVELYDNSKPIKFAQRRYPPAKRQFLEHTASKLLEMGFLKPLPESDWVSAPLVVPKAPPVNFRLTIDLRPINAATKPMSWPMPNIESELSDPHSSKFFASIDFCVRLLAATATYVVSKTSHLHDDEARTLQGIKNSGANLQSRYEPCFTEIRPSLKA